MIRLFSIAMILLLLSGCSKSVVEKPDNLIAKNRMVDIIYDLSLLYALESQNPIYLENNGIEPRRYIYQKYKIDSLQFANSNKYYASDLVEYKKIYDKVNQRLEENKKLSDSIIKAKGMKSTPVDADSPIVR